MHAAFVDDPDPSPPPELSRGNSTADMSNLRRQSIAKLSAMLCATDASVSADIVTPLEEMCVRRLHQRVRLFYNLIQLYIEDPNFPFIEEWLTYDEHQDEEVEAFHAQHEKTELEQIAAMKDLVQQILVTPEEEVSQEEKVKKLDDIAKKQKLILIRRMRRQKELQEARAEHIRSVFVKKNKLCLENEEDELEYAKEPERLVQSVNALLGKIFVFLKACIAHERIPRPETMLWAGEKQRQLLGLVKSGSSNSKVPAALAQKENISAAGGTTSSSPRSLDMVAWPEDLESLFTIAEATDSKLKQFAIYKAEAEQGAISAGQAAHMRRTNSKLSEHHSDLTAAFVAAQQQQHLSPKGSGKGSGKAKKSGKGKGGGGGSSSVATASVAGDDLSSELPLEDEEASNFLSLANHTGAITPRESGAGTTSAPTSVPLLAPDASAVATTHSTNGGKENISAGVNTTEKESRKSASEGVEKETSNLLNPTGSATGASAKGTTPVTPSMPILNITKADEREEGRSPQLQEPMTPVTVEKKAVATEKKSTQTLIVETKATATGTLRTLQLPQGTQTELFVRASYTQTDDAPPEVQPVALSPSPAPEKKKETTEVACQAELLVVNMQAAPVMPHGAAYPTSQQQQQQQQSHAMVPPPLRQERMPAPNQAPLPTSTLTTSSANVQQQQQQQQLTRQQQQQQGTVPPAAGPMAKAPMPQIMTSQQSNAILQAVQQEPPPQKQRQQPGISQAAAMNSASNATTPTPTTTTTNNNNNKPNPSVISGQGQSQTPMQQQQQSLSGKQTQLVGDSHAASVSHGAQGTPPSAGATSQEKQSQQRLHDSAGRDTGVSIGTEMEVAHSDSSPVVAQTTSAFTTEPTISTTASKKSVSPPNGTAGVHVPPPSPHQQHPPFSSFAMQMDVAPAKPYHQNMYNRYNDSSSPTTSGNAALGGPSPFASHSPGGGGHARSTSPQAHGTGTSASPQIASTVDANNVDLNASQTIRSLSGTVVHTQLLPSSVGDNHLQPGDDPMMEVVNDVLLQPSGLAATYGGYRSSTGAADDPEIEFAELRVRGENLLKEHYNQQQQRGAGGGVGGNSVAECVVTDDGAIPQFLIQAPSSALQEQQEEHLMPSESKKEGGGKEEANLPSRITCPCQGTNESNFAKTMTAAEQLMVSGIVQERTTTLPFPTPNNNNMMLNAKRRESESQSSSTSHPLTEDRTLVKNPAAAAKLQEMTSGGYLIYPSREKSTDLAVLMAQDYSSVSCTPITKRRLAPLVYRPPSQQQGKKKEEEKKKEDATERETVPLSRSSDTTPAKVHSRGFSGVRTTKGLAHPLHPTLGKHVPLASLHTLLLTEATMAPSSSALSDGSEALDRTTMNGGEGPEQRGGAEGQTPPIYLTEQQFEKLLRKLSPRTAIEVSCGSVDETGTSATTPPLPQLPEGLTDELRRCATVVSGPSAVGSVKGYFPLRERKKWEGAGKRGGVETKTNSSSNAKDASTSKIMTKNANAGSRKKTPLSAATGGGTGDTMSEGGSNEPDITPGVYERVVNRTSVSNCSSATMTGRDNNNNNGRESERGKSLSCSREFEYIVARK